MRYNQFGNTGLLVSELCLGMMTFGGNGFWRVFGAVDQTAADTMIGRALDAGINFFDVANVYSDGEAERMLGAGLGARRKDAVIATKVKGKTGAGPNESGLSRGHIMRAVDDSLARLNTEYIDLYQIHGFDPYTRLEETLRALDDLVSAGKVRYIGCSNLAAWQLMKALGISAAREWARFDSLQAYYSLACRDIEREIVPLLNDQQVGLLAWGALASGFLSGKYSRENGRPAGARRSLFDFPPLDRERTFDILDVIREIAADHEATLAQIAVAWLLHRPIVTSVILGVTSHDQLEENLRAAEIELTSGEMARLDAASALTPEYPGWMLERDDAQRTPSAARPSAAAPA